MLTELVLVLYVMVRSALARAALWRDAKARRWWWPRTGDAGEGVISTAIAVLIIAFLGAAMYVVFQGLLEASGSKATDQVNQIGGDGAN
jgi:hypothetical protein